MLSRLEPIIDEATALGLAVVISNHRDPALIADPAAPPGGQPGHGRATGRAPWRVAAPTSSLEPLTEPQQALDPMWNTVAAELIGAVRGQDGQGTILLGPRSYNNARFLGELSLPGQRT